MRRASDSGVFGRQENLSSFIVSNCERALENNEFVVYYQPKYNFVNNSVVGAEALVRWDCKSKNMMINPNEFIKLFEYTNFVVSLDKYVLRKTFEFQKNLIDKGITPVPISVNMSRYESKDNEYVDYLKELLNEFAISASLIHIEVTETLYINNPRKLIDTVKNFHSIGIQVELDDFGSGYSSLKTLADLPVDVIKVDSYLVKNLDKSLKNQYILSSCIRTAHWLNLPIVTEGIENRETAEKVLKLGCKLMQGFFFSKPLKEEEFVKLLQNQPIGKFGIDTNKFVPSVAIDNALAGDMLDILLGSQNVSESINRILRLLGEHLKINRLCLVKDDETHEYGTYSNFWCKNPTELQNQKLDKIKYKEIFGCKIENMLDEFGLFVSDDVETIAEDKPKEFFRKVGIKSICIAGIYRHGKLQEHVAFSTREEKHEWTNKEIAIIRTFARILSAVEAGLEFDQSKEFLNSYQSIVDDSLDFCYIIDPKTKEIIYYNKMVLNSYGDVQGKVCHKVLMGLDAPCPNCPFDHFMMKNEIVTKEIVTPQGNTYLASSSPIIYNGKKAGFISAKNVDSLVVDKRRERTRIKVLNALIEGTLFTAIHDLVNCQTTLLHVFKFQDTVLDLTSFWNTWIESDIREADQERIKKIIDLKTIGERLRKEDAIVFDVDTIRLGKIQIRLIVLEKDGNGFVTKFISSAYKSDGNQVISESIRADIERLLKHTRKTEGGDEFIRNEYYTTQHLNIDTEEYAQILNAAKIGVWSAELVPGQKPKLYCNDIMETLIGVEHGTPPEECYVAHRAGMVPEYVDAFDKYTEDIIKTGTGEVTYKWQYPNGKQITVRCVGVLDKKFKDGQRFCGYHQDISSAVEIQQKLTDEYKKLEYIAVHDGQTGLLHRAAAEEAIKDYLKTSTSKVAFILIDLDCLKQINDQYGHETGDRAIKTVSNGIRRYFGSENILGRFGGDEFVVLVREFPQDNAIQVVVDKFLNYVGETKIDNELKAAASVSIGIAIYAGGEVDFETLYRQADSALYYVKKNGKNSYAFYNDSIKLL